LYGKREFWGRWRSAGVLGFEPSLQNHWLRKRSGARRVLSQKLIPVRGRSSIGNCLGGTLSSLAFEGLPLSRVFVVRNHLHYPLSLIKRGGGSTSLGQHKKDGHNRRWQAWRWIGRRLD